MKIFDALNEHFEGQLTTGGIPVPNELQEAVLKRTKQGGDLFVVAAPESGKTMAAMMAAIQKCPDSMEGSPRVIYICADNEKARKLTTQLTLVTRRKEIMIEPANDKGNQIEQRINIYDGADIVIGNVQRIYDLYIQNGINLGELRLIILDDTELLMKEKLILGLRRLSTGLPKCQRFIFANTLTEKVESFAEEFLIHPHEIID